MSRQCALLLRKAVNSNTLLTTLLEQDALCAHKCQQQLLHMLQQAPGLKKVNACVYNY
jgi:hypothetical protein